jgi:hypothetical protein
MRLSKYVDKKRKPLKKSKTIAKYSFFSTQIPIENRNNKVPLLFQNPIINSIIMKEEKKKKLFSVFLSKTFGYKSKIFKKIIDNDNNSSFNLSSFFSVKNDKFDFSIKNYLHKDKLKNHKIFPIRNNSFVLKKNHSSNQFFFGKRYNQN